MLRKTFKTLAIAAGVLTLAATTATAQGNPQTNKVTTTVNDVLRLTIAGTTNIALPANAFDVSDTYVGSATTGVDVAANRPWTLNVKANTGFFADSLGAASAKPAGDLAMGISYASGQNFTALVAAGSEQPVLTGTGRNVASSTNRGRATGTVSYKLTFNLTDAPNKYSLDVVYTLVGN